MNNDYAAKTCIERWEEFLRESEYLRYLLYLEEKDRANYEWEAPIRFILDALYPDPLARYRIGSPVTPESASIA